MGSEAEEQGSDSGDNTLGLELALQRARAGGNDPIADALLAKQTEKLEHELHHLKLRTLNEWFSLLLKGLGALVSLAVVVAIAAMAWNASQSHALIVEPFHTPPDLAAKGLDGATLAAQVLDRLEEMRANTSGAHAAAGYSSEGAEAKLEIPDTGVSVGELKRALQDWLGHDTHISGSLVHQGDQLVLTERTGAAAKDFRGPESDPDHLVGQAAEEIYAATQPLSFLEYLISSNRYDEALDQSQRLIGQGSRPDRAWAFLELGRVLEHNKDYQGALHALNEAASLNPRLWIVWGQMADLQEFSLGDEEQALASRRRAVAADDFGDADPNVVESFHVADKTYVDEAVGDYAAAFAINVAEAQAQTDPSLAYPAEYLAAYEAAYLHDIALSRLWLRRAMDRVFALRSIDTGHTADKIRHRVQYWHFAELGDWTGAAKEIDLAANGEQVGGVSAYWYALEAIALARAGQPDKAKAIADILPPRCLFCLLSRAIVAEAEGNRAAADALLAQALRIYPSQVRPYQYWGAVKLARGDANGAIALFAQAHTKGPHFADPLEGWGEALMIKGDYAGAVTKFAEANNYAANWGHLHLEWARALRKQGRDPAEQLHIASTLALSAADRKALTAPL